MKIDLDHLQAIDGYHTFDELYEHRHFLLASLMNVLHFTNSMIAEGPESEEVFGRTGVWKSRKHHDGSEYVGMFVAGIGTAEGATVTYHMPDRMWQYLDAPERETAPKWDGHTANDVLLRLADKFFKRP